MGISLGSILFRIVSSHVIMLLLYGVFTAPSMRWPPGHRFIETHMYFAAILLVPAVLGNTLGARWPWLERLLLMSFLFIIAAVFSPAIVY